MDDEPVLGEFRQLAGHAIVEPHAEGQNQVGFVHGIIGIHRAVHAQHAQRIGSVAGNAPRPITVVATGMFGFAHQFAQLLAGIAADHAAAGVNDRSFGTLDRRGHLANLLGLRFAIFDVVARQVHRHVIVRLDGGQLHVLGQIDKHRTLPAGGGDVECFAHHSGNIVYVGHQDNDAW